jgi:endoglucanase
MTLINCNSSSSAIRRPAHALAALACAASLGACGGGSSNPSPPIAQGVVRIAGNRVLRDGAPWVPHAVQMVAFVAPPAAQQGAFAAAYAHYSPAEFAAIKAWGADSVRIQLSQPGADPADPHYDAAFVKQYVDAVRTARSVGLNVIVSIQDETQSGETNAPATLPNAATQRVWQNLAPMLNGDDGIVYEMFNEPQPQPSDANWQQWAAAMNTTIAVIRATGATNTLLADGLWYAQTLDGMIPLTDPLQRVFYSTHPYFHNKADQDPASWKAKFGNAAASVPVIVGEWTTATTYYTDDDTANAALQMLQYMQSIGVGLVAVTYDFGLPNYGGIVSDYNGTPTSYANGLKHGDSGWGPGTLIQNWYRSGVVPKQLQ